jgi:uncharacterized protein (TIGR03086 family)
MTDPLARYLAAADGFARVLALMRPTQPHSVTPCAEWDVHMLVNHMARGNLNYALLASGGSGSEFLALRDQDALGEAPVTAYGKSVRECAESFRRPGVLDQVLDYPLGKITGRQALAVRTADSVIHTWDLARALGVSDCLDPHLVAWILAERPAIYAGLDGMAAFFGPVTSGEPSESDQNRLVRGFGRTPGWNPPVGG